MASLLSLCVSGFVLGQLFIGSDAGLADNADGRRLMCRVGWVKHPAAPQANSRMRVVFDYVPRPPVHEHCTDEAELQYRSSQEFLVRVAVGIADVVGATDDGTFDLRFVGVLSSLAFGLSFGALYLALPGSERRRLLLVGVSAFLLADIMFVTYFTSAYAEPMGFVAIVLTVAALAWYLRVDEPRAIHLSAVASALVLLACSKSQAVPFAVIGGGLLLLRRIDVDELRGPVAGRVVPALGALAVLITGAIYLTAQGEKIEQANLDNLVFFSILADSDDPAADMRAMGLPEQLGAYAGISHFMGPGHPRGDEAYPEFEAKMNRTRAIKFLATHPDRAMRMFKKTVEAVPNARVGYLANFDKTPNPGPRLAHRINPSERILGLLRPVSWPLLPIGLALTAFAGLRAWWRSSGPRQVLGPLAFFLAAGAFSQLIAVPLGDGYYELHKHLIFAAYCTAFLVAFGVAALAEEWVRPRVPEVVHTEEPAYALQTAGVR